MNFQELIRGFERQHENLCYSYRSNQRIVSETFGILCSKILFFRTQLNDLPENSAVLIASSKIDSLIPLFFSCLSLNLRPAFIAYPSQKVSNQDYQSKLSHILDNFLVKRIIIEEHEREIFKNISQSFVLTDYNEQNSANLQEINTKNSNPSFIQFSSGSTGTPKAMQFEFISTFKHTSFLQNCINMSSSDYLLSWLPLYHDMGLIAATLYPLFQGKKFHMMSPFDWIQTPSLFLSDGQKIGATHAWMPNFAFELLSQRCKDFECDLSSWKMLASCAEPVVPDTVKRFYDTFKNRGLKSDCLAATYAMAENTFAMTHKVFDMHTSSQFISLNTEAYLNNDFVLSKDPSKSTVFTSCGTPIDGTYIDCPIDSIGPIKIKGESCLSEYLGNSQNIIDSRGYFDTGDIGFIHNKELYICGRKSDLIIVRGVNIFPQNLEKIIDQIPGFIKGRSVALSQWDNQEATEEVIILAEVEQGINLVKAKDELKRRLKAYLDFDIRKIKLLPRGWLRKTSSGKIARKPNLEKIDESLQKPILILGDSHIYAWNQSDELYNADTTAQNVFLRQIPIISADNIHSDGRIDAIYQNLNNLPEFSTVVLFIGEQDIRNLIPFWMRTKSISLVDATSEVLRKHFQWISKLTQEYPTLNFCWLLPPPPGEGLKPHPRFLSQEYLSNELYYHYQADQNLRRSIALEYRRQLLINSPTIVIDYWDSIADQNLIIHPHFIRDISHLKNVKQLFEDHLEAKMGCVFSPTKTIIQNSKITLVVENIAYEMKKFLNEFIENEHIEDSLLLEELDSMSIVRIVSQLQLRYEVKVPSQWMNKNDWKNFESFCNWVMLNRIAQTPFEK